MPKELFDLDGFIAYADATPEDSWCVNVCRTKDGRSCVLAHVFDFAGGDGWDWFEQLWATEYMIFPVNDGNDPRYPQATPKQRSLAYLRDLRDGTAKNTRDYLAEDGF